VALIVRLALVVATSRGEGERVGDAADYHSYALSLAHDQTYHNADGDRATRMPGYPLMLAAQYKTLGQNPLITQIGQSVLGALTCVLVAAIVSFWWPAPWPLIAGLLASAYFDLIEPCARLLTEAPTTFFVMLTLWLILSPEKAPVRRISAAAVSASMACLLRPEFIPWIALVSAFVYFHLSFKKTALFASIALIGVIAWAARNTATLGRPIFTTTAGSFNFYGWGIPRTIEERQGSPKWERAPVGAKELERQDFYAQRSRLFFRENWKAVSTIKAVITNALILYYPFSPALDASFIFVFPLAIIGLAARRRNASDRILWGTCAYLTAVYCVAGVMIPRHRQTYSGIIIIFGVAGLRFLASKMPRQRFLALTALWALLCTGAWCVAPRLRQMILTTVGRSLS
jgi:hypothetical protein